ncbi:hypothetical protein ABWH93_01045 [Seohaeicola saemankumensis]|uniref:hypothetical protein n=1 Tax=Seohaeicola TaxID=481178 RepID=UPI0035CEB61C
MAGNTSTALVVVPHGEVALARKESKITDPLRLVRDDVHLHDREEARKYLPDILGRALARIWIDQSFAQSFASDPKATLEQAGVHLPDTMGIEFEKASSDRPKIIVYDQQPNSKFRMRVLYLQLVMMAGK